MSWIPLTQPSARELLTPSIRRSSSRERTLRCSHDQTQPPRGTQDPGSDVTTPLPLSHCGQVGKISNWRLVDMQKSWLIICVCYELKNICLHKINLFCNVMKGKDESLSLQHQDLMGKSIAMLTTTFRVQQTYRQILVYSKRHERKQS